MTSNTTKNQQDQVKQHLALVLNDLKKTAKKDGSAIALIGSLAAHLSDTMKQQTWSDAKEAMSDANRAELLNSFKTRGKAAEEAGQKKQAYAMQALATSLVASALRSDRTIAEGEGLLDAMIDRAIVVYRQFQASAN